MAKGRDSAGSVCLPRSVWRIPGMGRAAGARVVSLGNRSRCAEVIAEVKASDGTRSPKRHCAARWRRADIEAFLGQRAEAAVSSWPGGGGGGPGGA
jgi:hypothetical protein